MNARNLNQSQKPEHTPTPWISDGLTIATVINDKNWIIAQMVTGEPQESDYANAAYIAKCVNLHFELVEGLEAAVRWINNNTDRQCLRMDELKDILARAKAGA